MLVIMPLAVIALVVGLHCIGLHAATSLPLLVLAQTATTFVMRAGVHEYDAMGPLAFGSVAAAAALQLIPSLTLRGACAVVLGVLTRRLLVRIPDGRLCKQVGRVVIVTGSSAGIGRETAKTLLQLGATVVYACRTEKKAKKAMESAAWRSAISGSPGRAMFIPLDLSSCASVRDFADSFNRTYERCDAIVCNAGAFFNKREKTKDGFECNLGCNHLGHQLLVELLLPKLRQSDGPRVVTVSSAMHRAATPEALHSDPMSSKGYGMFDAYAKSKLAQVVYAAELQRRELKRGSRVVSVCLHPGNVATEVTRNFPGPLHSMYNTFQPLMQAVQQSLGEGAANSVYGVASTSADGLHGAFLERGRPVAPLQGALDEEKGAAFFDKCEGWSALRP